MKVVELLIMNRNLNRSKTMADADKDFVEYVVKAIVESPDDVKVERKIDERGVLLILSVNPQDMGKVIGKEGRTAKALRTLLRVLGAKGNARINLKVAEPEGSVMEGKVAEKEEKSEEKSEEKPEENSEEEKVTEVL